MMPERLRAGTVFDRKQGTLMLNFFGSIAKFAVEMFAAGKYDLNYVKQLWAMLHSTFEWRGVK